MKAKFYKILVKLDGRYVEFDGIEYTEKEAKDEIKRLRKESDYKFKLDYVGTYENVILTVNPNIF